MLVIPVLWLCIGLTVSAQDVPEGNSAGNTTVTACVSDDSGELSENEGEDGTDEDDADKKDADESSVVTGSSVCSFFCFLIIYLGLLFAASVVIGRIVLGKF